MGPKLCRVTIFFGLHVVRLATDDYLLFGWTSSARCLPRTLASVRSFWLRSTLCRFEPDRKLYFSMGPKLCRHHLLWFTCCTTCNRQLLVVRINLFPKMPHQNIGLHTFFLTHAGQHCVDLSPIKNYNFGWGPNFVESPSSLVYMLYDLQQTITCRSDEPLSQDASPEHWPPYVLSDSGQHCVDL